MHENVQNLQKSTNFESKNFSEIRSSFQCNPTNGVEALDYLLSHAAFLGASDIHCDPKENGIFIRFRIDGQINDIGIFPRIILEEFIARLKILSGARTDLHFIPQDGRWRAELNGENYNIRISFMPTYYGENAVIRLLPAKIKGEFSLAKLGFIPEHIQSISKALEKKNGLILVTGPTGSGKTTTLHTCLSMKAKESLSIITLEDPVEYEIAGVRQIHIRQENGVTFAAGLRAALRQDPDVIMVGEIRDSETARVAIHISLTGHLVLSTLHTNSALETIPRLIDMGIDNYLLASTLKLVIAQRLVRSVCCECKSLGCERCRFTGYSGRLVIAEVCEIDRGFEDLIVSRRSISSLIDYAKSRGFRPIKEDGLEKIRFGITTREEVLDILEN